VELVVTAGVSQSTGQGWTQLAQFGIALVLSSAIGIEREIRQKSAGLRTYADGRGLLRTLVNECTGSGFAIAELKTISADDADDGIGRLAEPGGAQRSVQIALTLHGRGDLDALTARLVQVPGILSCRRTDSEGD
jgi:hypothetical protein